jgi:hypothetical protein
MKAGNIVAHFDTASQISVCVARKFTLSASLQGLSVAIGSCGNVVLFKCLSHHALEFIQNLPMVELKASD